MLVTSAVFGTLLGQVLAGGVARPASAALQSGDEGSTQAADEPSKPFVYIDADTGNEVDDPFAIYRALVAPEFHVVGLSSNGWGKPEDFSANTRISQTMNEEVLGLLDLKDRIPHPMGALHPMTDVSTPVDSAAARDIIAEAKATPDGQKLQVFVLGAYTNVASALLLDPSIKDKVTVHVMGFRYDDERLTPTEFNTLGDLHAAASLLKSGVELNIMPNSTTGEFHWTKAEVDAHFKGRGGIRDYLVKRWETFAPDDPQRILWDIAVFEAILRPELATLTEVVHEGARLHVWTWIDIPGMKADYWEATDAALSVSSKPRASYTPVTILRGGGRTWTTSTVLYHADDDSRDPHLAQFDGGTLISGRLARGQDTFSTPI